MSDTKKANVNTPSFAYNAMEQARELPRTLMGGTRAMREAGQKYLPQEPAESVEAYDIRRERSTLFNAYKQAVLDYVGKVFSKPIHPKEDVPDEIRGWLENVDLAGNDLNAFAKEVFKDASYGVSYILVDFPRIPAGRNLEEERKAGARPYCVHVPCQNLIGWKSARIGGVETLTQVRIRETNVEDDGEWGEKTVNRVRVLDLKDGVCTFTVWEEQHSATEGNTWKINPDLSGAMSIGFIPIVAVYTERTGFMSGEPPLSDLADLNAQHWRSSSDQENILHVARVPILFGSGFPEDGGSQMNVGAGSFTKTPSDTAKLQYVEHSGAAIESGRVSIQDIEDRMAKVAMDPMVRRPGTVTATETSVGTAKASCPLQAWAWGLQDSLELTLQYMGAWVGIAPDDCGGLDVNSDFGLSITDMTLAEMTQAYQAGLLSRQTIWAELQRRGRLSDDFDAEEEMDRLMTEARDGTIQSAATRFLNPGLAPGTPPTPASGPQPGQGEPA